MKIYIWKMLPGRVSNPFSMLGTFIKHHRWIRGNHFGLPALLGRHLNFVFPFLVLSEIRQSQVVKWNQIIFTDGNNRKTYLTCCLVAYRGPVRKLWGFSSTTSSAARKNQTGSISQQVFVGRRTRQQHPVGNRKILRFPKSHFITRCGTWVMTILLNDFFPRLVQRPSVCVCKKKTLSLSFSLCIWKPETLSPVSRDIKKSENIKAFRNGSEKTENGSVSL